MKGNIIKSVLGYWLFLLVAIIAARLLGFPQDNASITKIVAIVTAIYFVFGFIRAKFRK